MTLLLLSVGAGLGVAGGFGSLWLTHRRARWVTTGRTAAALLTLPLVLLIPAALVLVAAWLAPAAAWVAAVSLLVTRAVMLPRWEARA